MNLFDIYYESVKKYIADNKELFYKDDKLNEFGSLFFIFSTISFLYGLTDKKK